MNVSLGDRWEAFLTEAVGSGRYASVSEVVREGLRLVEEREAKLRALRADLLTSLAETGSVSDSELTQELERTADRLAHSDGL